MKKQELNHDKLLKDINELKKIDGDKNPEEVTQTVTLYAQVLNDGQNSSEDSEDKSVTSNEEVKESLLFIFLSLWQTYISVPFCLFDQPLTAPCSYPW